MNRKQAEHDRTVLPRIRELMAEGRSRREIAQQLQQDGIPTARRGGQWTHIAVGRILDRAERTPPEKASSPPPQAEQPPSPAEQPPPPAEPSPAPAPPRQESEAQTDAALDQLGTRVQDKLGTIEAQTDAALDQLGASVQNQLGTIESQLTEKVATLTRLSTWLWLRPVAVGVAICLAVSGVGWGYVTWLAASIESHREERGKLKVEIARQQATLRELEKNTWGVAFVESPQGNFITWPGHYKQPYKGAKSDPTYAGKWVAILVDE